MTTYGLCQLCPQLCLVFLAPLGTVWAQVGLLPLVLQKGKFTSELQVKRHCLELGDLL